MPLTVERIRECIAAIDRGAVPMVNAAELRELLAAALAVKRLEAWLVALRSGAAAPRNDYGEALVFINAVGRWRVDLDRGPDGGTVGNDGDETLLAALSAALDSAEARS